ncbi:uncharacterized protein LOC141670376 isoform X2 [Apium graveolens]|uniref:uncharacterized protein LOC141670376 isoform X2 n=1 Tax=Apium graveolens TaxID=4045 RepID=UPI003D79DA54
MNKFWIHNFVLMPVTLKIQIPQCFDGLFYIKMPTDSYKETRNLTLSLKDTLFGDQFLSMKLATVNLRLDFNIEGLLTKDILQSRAGPSSTLGFHLAMSMPYTPMHLAQIGLIQAGLAGIGPSPKELRRNLTSHLTSMSGGYKEPSSQNGIVGRTGAGNSSILNMLFRLNQFSKGHILVDGVNIANISLSDLHSHFSIIPQPPFLFERSLRTVITCPVLFLF